MIFFVNVPILTPLIGISFLCCMLWLLFKIWKDFFVMVFRKLRSFFQPK